ncbi:hypothetical protein F5882DRAFT_311498 [Hyaloscypha sp. PMI_1271]|nr:hypothetical protein F5882DRAFT_311498 [Hyaloscypha sp. PMI_1271]
MGSSANLLKKLQLFIDDKEQLLVYCRSEYGYALAVKHSQVTSHLRDKHQVTKSDRRGLTRHLTMVYPKGFRNPANLPPRDNSSNAYPQLHVHDGFSYREYTYYTINYPELSKHISKNHLNSRQASRARIQDLYY